MLLFRDFIVTITVADAPRAFSGLDPILVPVRVLRTIHLAFSFFDALLVGLFVAVTLFWALCLAFSKKSIIQHKKE